MATGVVYVLLYFYVASLLSVRGLGAAVFYGSVTVGPALFLQGLFDSSPKRTVAVTLLVWTWYSWSVYQGGI